jgi:nitrate/nitrite-specific signal transduction histidine kinase
VAAQTIYVPSDEVFARGNKYLALSMGIFSSIFAFVVLPIDRLLKWRVIQPIDRLTAIARKMTAGTMTAAQVGEFDDPSITKVAVATHNTNHSRPQSSRF